MRDICYTTRKYLLHTEDFREIFRSKIIKSSKIDRSPDIGNGKIAETLEIDFPKYPLVKKGPWFWQLLSNIPGKPV